MRQRGETPPPSYIPKKGVDNKRVYRRSGMYRGATLRKGGSLRRFSSVNEDAYRRCGSRFINAAVASQIISDPDAKSTPPQTTASPPPLLAAGMAPPAENISATVMNAAAMIVNLSPTPPALSLMIDRALTPVPADAVGEPPILSPPLSPQSIEGIEV